MPGKRVQVDEETWQALVRFAVAEPRMNCLHRVSDPPSCWNGITKGSAPSRRSWSRRSHLGADERAAPRRRDPTLHCGEFRRSMSSSLGLKRGSRRNEVASRISATPLTDVRRQIKSERQLRASRGRHQVGRLQRPQSRPHKFPLGYRTHAISISNPKANQYPTTPQPSKIKMDSNEGNTPFRIGACAAMTDIEPRGADGRNGW